MNKELYKRLQMDVTKFEAEDVITTSGETPTPVPPPFNPNNPWEMPAGT